MSNDLENITALNSYVTPEGKSGFFSRLFPSLTHYARLLSIVFKAGLLANKGEYTAQDWIRSSLDTVHSLELTGARFHVEGLEHLKALNAPCVFIGNHMSTLETFALPCLIQPHRAVTFVTKETLLKYPFFGKALGSRNPIVVGRVSPREDLTTVLREGAKRLEAGISVIVFPQSTRSCCFDFSEFNSMGVKLARRTGALILPVAIKTDAWGMGRFFKDAGAIEPHREVRFRFGPPLQVEGNGRAEHEQVCAFISGALAEWGMEIVPALGPGALAETASLPPGKAE